MNGLQGSLRPLVWAAVVMFLTTAPSGCQAVRRKPAEPVVIRNRYLGPRTIAVAPAINLSGSLDFDPSRFADVMADELGYCEGITVIPVSRALSALAVQGKDRVESPEHALELSRLVGADAILVFAVTRFDPYDPPNVGISAQVYAGEPISESRRTDGGGPESVRILAQTQHVFDASHDWEVDRVRSFAAARGADDSPYGWRKYIVSQQHFMQYCCHQMILALMDGHQDDQGPKADGSAVRAP